MATATKAKKRSSDGLKLQPLGDRVVVEREESEAKTAGGIVLPDSAKDKPSRGTIIAVGTGRVLDDGKRSKLQVKVGDKVLFTSYAPETIKINDEELLLMREEEHPGDHRLNLGASFRYSLRRLRSAAALTLETTTQML